MCNIKYKFATKNNERKSFSPSRYTSSGGQSPLDLISVVGALYSWLWIRSNSNAVRRGANVSIGATTRRLSVWGMATTFRLWKKCNIVYDILQSNFLRNPHEFGSRKCQNFNKEFENHHSF